MSKYFYQITGNYKENIKIKKEKKVIHDGYLIGLLSYVNERLELNLNYGEGTCHPCEIKKLNDLIITIPIKEYLNKSDYQYIPLVFESEEYSQLIETCYIDRELSEKMHQVNKQDIYDVLLMCFKLEFNISEVFDFKDILDSIITNSVADNKVTECIFSLLSNKNVNIKKIDDMNSINISLYIDFQDQVYEWNSVVKVGENYYFDLVDNYVIGIS